jgi:hypothetical protein
MLYELAAKEGAERCSQANRSREATSNQVEAAGPSRTIGYNQDGDHSEDCIGHTV